SNPIVARLLFDPDIFKTASPVLFVLTLISPATCNLACGTIVAIPTLPVLFTYNLVLSPLVFKAI
ncbi:MAG: hypothetical protein EBY90_04205, partial [Actinobacteria bacterium]|nr:hypothetical protein [Actinomycetota bacterium]